VPQDAHQDSRFCATCHQFEADGYALNGKLLENTFEQWRKSPQAKSGITCQSCHMPGRRHQWRGIHHRAMVLSGVTIKWDHEDLTQERITGQLVLTNQATGRFFPTYVTPRVVLEAVQLDCYTKPIDQTRQTSIVAREVSLDLSREYSDTRLPPGASARLFLSGILSCDPAKWIR
jgi:hypothetical protein